MEASRVFGRRGGVSTVGRLATRRLGDSIPRVLVNSAIGIRIHVGRNRGREVRIFRNAIVTGGGDNVTRAFAIHHMSCNINIRHMFPMRSPSITGIRLMHGNHIHETGLCCLHSEINGTTGIGRGVWPGGVSVRKKQICALSPFTFVEWLVYLAIGAVLGWAILVLTIGLLQGGQRLGGPLALGEGL